MAAVAVSRTYRIVIPRAVREQMVIRPGDQIETIARDDRISLIRIRPAHEVRGFLKGLDPTFARDERDRM